jgi:hypothetical protein
MPLFMVERTFPVAFELAPDDVIRLRAGHEEVGVRWVYSFLSADRRRAYCLFEASGLDAVRRAAAFDGLPVDSVVPVSEIQPDVLVRLAAANEPVDAAGPGPE